MGATRRTSPSKARSKSRTHARLTRLYEFIYKRMEKAHRYGRYAQSRRWAVSGCRVLTLIKSTERSDAHVDA